MKIKRTIILIALFAAGSAIAQPATNAPPASTAITVEKVKVHWFTPVEKKKSGVNYRPTEGLDDRSWTTIAGWDPGASAFPTPETHKSQFTLFWINIERSQKTIKAKAQP